jgi:hypothetical protein
VFLGLIMPDMMRAVSGVKPESGRVVRGGSFNNNQDNLRCAFRNRNNPDNRNNNRGFRLVCGSSIMIMIQLMPAVYGPLD